MVLLFPSYSASFVFSEVLHLPEFISFGKLRMAWAEGATDTDPYRINTTYSAGFLGGQMGLAATLFQVGIAVGGVCLVMKKKELWYISLSLAALATLQMIRVLYFL